MRTFHKIDTMVLGGLAALYIVLCLPVVWLIRRAEQVGSAGTASVEQVLKIWAQRDVAVQLWVALAAILLFIMFLYVIDRGCSPLYFLIPGLVALGATHLIVRLLVSSWGNYLYPSLQVEISSYCLAILPLFVGCLAVCLVAYWVPRRPKLTGTLLLLGIYCLGRTLVLLLLPGGGGPLLQSGKNFVAQIHESPLLFSILVLVGPCLTMLFATHIAYQLVTRALPAPLCLGLGLAGPLAFLAMGPLVYSATGNSFSIGAFATLPTLVACPGLENIGADLILLAAICAVTLVFMAFCQRRWWSGALGAALLTLTTLASRTLAGMAQILARQEGNRWLNGSTVLVIFNVLFWVTLALGVALSVVLCIKKKESLPGVQQAEEMRQQVQQL